MYQYNMDFCCFIGWSWNGRLIEKVNAVSRRKDINIRPPIRPREKALRNQGFFLLLFLRIAPVLPRPQLLALTLAFFGTGRTVKAVGPSGRKQLSALPAAQRLAPLH